MYVKESYPVFEVYKFLVNTARIKEKFPKFTKWYVKILLELLISLVLFLPKSRRFFVARHPYTNEIIGVLITKNTSFDSKICTLFVRTGNRKQYIGTQLTNAAVKSFTDNEKEQLYIEVCPSDFETFEGFFHHVERILGVGVRVETTVVNEEVKANA